MLELSSAFACSRVWIRSFACAFSPSSSSILLCIFLACISFCLTFSSSVLSVPILLVSVVSSLISCSRVLIWFMIASRSASIRMRTEEIALEILSYSAFFCSSVATSFLASSNFLAAADRESYDSSSFPVWIRKFLNCFIFPLSIPICLALSFCNLESLC